MSLYPSLEDMKVDQIMQAQNMAFGPAGPASFQPSAPPTQGGSPAGFYPGLQDYMGLELSEETIRVNMPEYLALATPQPTQVSQVAIGSTSMIAPLSSESPAFAKSQINHGIRQVILCKDASGKVGIRVKSVNKGVFVGLVIKGSPAALGGLRFGDQILQINSENVAGFSENKVNDILKKAGVNNIVLAVRDRPFERTLTLHKDSTGHLGFEFKNGKITAIAVGSSAARNGLLIDHNLLEVNGQNVVGIKDKEISNIIDDGGKTVTITVIPTFLFDHIMKNISSSLVKKMMDHTIPDL